MNTYLYANGNPLMYSDRLGLEYGNGKLEFEDIAFGPSYWLNQQLGWDPAYDQGTLDFWAGAGDTASFGASGWVRDLNGTADMVDKCSGAYLAGELAAVAATPLGRGAYMYRAAQIPKLALTARQAISMRNMLRYTYRGPLTRIPFFATWHMRTYLEFVAKGRTDAEIIANAGNISRLWNSIFGGITAAAAGYKIQGQSACDPCSNK